MKKQLTAFISLGFCCGGPEMGDYGEFTVELSDEENAIIEGIIKEETQGYKRETLEERYPELHSKIVSAGEGLARDVVIHDGVSWLEEPISDEDEIKMSSMSYHEQAEFLAQNYGLEPESLEGAEVCYYLCKEELPEDFDSRA